MTSQIKILIVEDQFIEANHLRIMLQKKGHIVTGIARNFQDAKNLITKEKPDLVLLDIFLSGKKTGIDLAKELQEENIPFIYLSANSNEDVLNKAKMTHPHGFLVKPFKEQDLFVSMEIAKYHAQHGLESYIRKEQLFHKQLKDLDISSENWEERLFKISIALQPLIPFDLIIAVFTKDKLIAQEAFGYIRIGFNEYQKIGMEEFQNMSSLKESEVRELQRKTRIETSIKAYNGMIFKALCKMEPMKKLIAERMNMNSNLLLPIPLKINDKGSFYLSFYSRNPETYNDNHLVLCERLQRHLIYTIENIFINEKRKTISHLEANSLIEIKKDIKNLPVNGFTGIIGRSSLLLQLFDHVMQVAPVDTTVLITGESGTGKERIASSIHNLSLRKNEPYIKVNCAALPSNLIESELFGHEKGAFTGAHDQRIGRFEQANKGTLFLDEIGEIPLEMQVKLLRVLQEKELERIGGKSTIKINVRIIAATNRNLEKEVAEGRFRLDLYYRLNVFPIRVPSLKDRKEDIPLLTHHFIKLFNQKMGKNILNISELVIKKMLEYDWPGNIRELENLWKEAYYSQKALLLMTYHCQSLQIRKTIKIWD